MLVYLLKRGNQELYPPGAVQDDCLSKDTTFVMGAVL